MCSWIRKCNIIKAAILPKAIQAFEAIAVEVAIVLFEKQQATTTKPPEIFAKFTENLKGLHITQSLGSFRPQLSWIQNTWQSYSKSKQCDYWHADRHAEQKRRRGFRDRPSCPRQMIFSNGAGIVCGERVDPDTRQWKNCTFICSRMKVDPYPLYIKINSKWIKGLALWPRPAASATQETQAGGWHV